MRACERLGFVVILLSGACSFTPSGTRGVDATQLDAGSDSPATVPDDEVVSTGAADLREADDLVADAVEAGPVGANSMGLPRSMVCGTGPDVVEYPDMEWDFVKPLREDGGGGPFTVRDLQRGIGSQRAIMVSPAKHLHPRRTIGGGLWLAPDEDVVIHLGVQSDWEPEYWETARVSLTPLIDWEPVGEASYEVWSDDRSQLKITQSGTGGYFAMDSQTVLIDLIIPGAAFEENSWSELAIAVRARSQEKQYVKAQFIRFTVYAGGADKRPHACIPPADTRPIDEAFPFDQYGNYLVGRHFGLIKPHELDWGDLPGIHVAAPGSEIPYDWFVYAHSPERTVAFVPIVNGKPVAPVEFTQIDNGGSGEFRLGYDSSFTAMLPEETDEPVDVYVAEWFDPFYPIEDPYGEWVVFPDDDYHYHAGERVMKSHSMGGTNVLRYELEASP